MPRETKAQREKREQEEAAARPQIDAVVVIRQRAENGNISWVIGEIIGNIDADMVPMGLEMAAKDVRERILGQAKG